MDRKRGEAGLREENQSLEAAHWKLREELLRLPLYLAPLIVASLSVGQLPAQFPSPPPPP